MCRRLLEAAQFRVAHCCSRTLGDSRVQIPKTSTTPPELSNSEFSPFFFSRQIGYILMAMPFHIRNLVTVPFFEDSGPPEDALEARI